MTDPLTADPKHTPPQCIHGIAYGHECRACVADAARYEAAARTSKTSGDSIEVYYAEMESERNNSLKAYFAARPQLDRTLREEAIFRAGFERAYELLWPRLPSETDDPPEITEEMLSHAKGVWRIGQRVVTAEEGKAAFRDALKVPVFLGMDLAKPGSECSVEGLPCGCRTWTYANGKKETEPCAEHRNGGAATDQRPAAREASYRICGTCGRDTEYCVCPL